MRSSAKQVYYVIAASGTVASTVAFTTFTVYYVRAAHLAPLELTLVGTALELSYFATTVPAGLFADSVSRRASVILGWFLGATASLAVAVVPSFGGLLLANVVLGLSAAFVEGAIQAWIADEVGDDRAGEIFVRGSQIARVVAIPAMALGGVLATVRLDIPWLFAAAVQVVTAGYLLARMPEHRRRIARASSRPPVRETLRAGTALIRRRRLLLGLIVASVCFGAASEGQDRLGGAHLLANFEFPTIFGLGAPIWFSVLGIASALAATAVTEAFRPRIERASATARGSATGLMVLAVVTMSCFAVFGLASSFAVGASMLVVAGVARSMSEPLFDALQVRSTEPETRATVMSIVAMGDATGQIAGGPAVGALGNASLRVAMGAAGALMIPVVAVYAAVRRSPPVPRHAEATVDAASRP